MFDLLRRQWHGDDVILCAFDLLELDGEDLRRAPIEERKAALAKLLRQPPGGIALNEHYTGDAAIIYKHAYGSAARASYRNGWGHRTARAAPSVGEGQEPGGARGHARGRGGVELKGTQVLGAVP